MARGGRRRLGVDLSEEAFEAWHTYARAHGVSVTALLEVLGQRLGRRRFPADIREWLDDLVAHARKIDAERARGGGRRPSA